jgi:hypothetical protein
MIQQRLSGVRSLGHVEASGFVSSLTSSATRDTIMFKMTRGLANRGIARALDRKPRVANLLIVHLTASLLAIQFVAFTTGCQNVGPGCLVDLP